MRETARINAELQAKAESEQAERERLEREQNAEFLRNQKQLAKDKDDEYPESNQSQMSVDDEDLLNVVATSGNAVGAQGGSENKATVDEKIDVNESGDSDSGKDVGSQDGPENKATFDEKIDENESSDSDMEGEGGRKYDVDDDDSNESKKDSVDESVEEEQSSDPLQASDPKNVEVEEVLDSVFDWDDRNFSDGPKSSDMPVLMSLFNEEEAISASDKRDRDGSQSDDDEMVPKQLKLSEQDVAVDLEQSIQFKESSDSGHSGGGGGGLDDLHEGVDGKGDQCEEVVTQNDSGEDSTLKEGDELGVGTDLCRGKVGEEAGLGGDSSGGKGGEGAASQ